MGLFRLSKREGVIIRVAAETMQDHQQRPVFPFYVMLIGYLAAPSNILTGWYGLAADENGFVPLSLAEFSLWPVLTSTKGWEESLKKLAPLVSIPLDTRI